MSYSFNATCRFELPGRTIDDIREVLLPEVEGEGDRTLVELDREDDEFVLRIRSKDIKGLRAATNSYLRWIECSLKITQLPK